MAIPAKGVPAKEIPVRKREVAAPVVAEFVEVEAPKKAVKTTKKAAPKE